MGKKLKPNKIAVRPDLPARAVKMLDPTAEPKSLPSIGHVNYSKGTLEAIAYQLEHPKDKKDSNSVLDNIILKNGNDGVPFYEIARITGTNPAAVKNRYFELLKAENTFTPAEMHLWLTMKLRSIINYLNNAAEMGNVESAKQIIAAVEQLSKIYDLVAKNEPEAYRLVSEAQGALIVTIVQHVTASVTEAIQQSLNARGVRELIPVEVIDAVTADALGQAQTLVEAHGETGIEV